MKKITVTIITLNEEANIGECLESVKWADEIIVSDSGSTDRTVEICTRYGAKVYADRWLGFGRQKNLCQARAANTWILNLDSDERVTPGLAREISALPEETDKSGYYIPRKNFFGERWVKHCGWYPDYNLRLYRKDLARFNLRGVHEAVESRGAKGYLKNPLIHRTYKDVRDYLKRMERYSTLAAKDMAREGRSAGLSALILRPLFTFLKMFFLRKGFLEGFFGLRLSKLYAQYTFRKYKKLRELKRGFSD
ncbi:MAG: glycosyltransferase family 2 protein [Thermodesulfobacteriota bacterium]